MGDGQRLHERALSDASERGREVLTQAVTAAGAFIAGRRTYDTSVAWWGADDPTDQARLTVFVVSHDESEEKPRGGVYTFVTGGIERALREAKAAAGDKIVHIMGIRPATARRIIDRYLTAQVFASGTFPALRAVNTSSPRRSPLPSPGPSSG